MAIFANWFFFFFHKLGTHRAIIGHTPKLDLDLLRVVQFIKNIGRNDFSDQFRKIIIRYNRTGYNMNVMRQTSMAIRLCFYPFNADIAI